MRATKSLERVTSLEALSSAVKLVPLEALTVLSPQRDSIDLSSPFGENHTFGLGFCQTLRLPFQSGSSPSQLVAKRRSQGEGARLYIIGNGEPEAIDEFGIPQIFLALKSTPIPPSDL